MKVFGYRQFNLERPRGPRIRTFVHDEQFCLPDHRTSESDDLSLPCRQVLTSRGYLGIQLESIIASILGGIVKPLCTKQRAFELRFAVSLERVQVLANRPLEQLRLDGASGLARRERICGVVGDARSEG